jgi:glycogen debranching enzyme
MIGGGDEAATPAADIRDVQTLKHEGLFQLCDRYGDITEEPDAALGLYFRDTRFLSRWLLLVDGRRPLPLHAEADRNFSMLVETTYACERPMPDGRRRTENVQISRHRWLEGGFRESIKIQNFGHERVMRVELRFGADFLDLFEVRGMKRETRGTIREPEVAPGRVTLSYDGRDGVRRELAVSFDPAPDELDARHATWNVTAATKTVVQLDISVRPRAGKEAPAALSHEQLEAEYTRWRKRCTRFRVSNDLMQRYLDRAVLDLRMMQTTSEDGTPAMDAGVPWFSTLFGRDSLLAAYQALGVNTDMARGTLVRLAELQGTTDDPWRDEEPGKILHEIRTGEMAALGEIPHTPYYGSIDATPLWLVLYGYVWKWTGDLDFVEQLWPNAERALAWIDHHGDRDGDGYVEYAKRSEGGLDNQGWKDSFDGILHEDGTIPEAPLALCEVQGYVYDGKRRTAGVARALGKEDVARELEAQAQALKERFNRDFWMNDYGTYAVALDGNKRQVRSLTSNAGQCLWSGIVDAPKASRVARRLLAPDMLSGWGVRTLSKRNPSYDPIGYHTGTVWPHDNSLIAHGMRLYGLTEEAHRVIDELAIAGSYFGSARYPELFCGYGKEEVPVPVEYPVACRPQAWATGAPLLMIRSYAGMSADAPNKTLSIVRPSLPTWVERAEVIGMRVGEARCDLLFVQREGTTGVQVLRKDGELDIVVRY